VGDLRTGVRDLLKQYYGQRANSGTPTNVLAPRYESEKWPAAKDPDTLFEYGGNANTDCHGAMTRGEFVDCTGYRLAATFNLSGYAGGLTLFDDELNFYANEAVARIAGYYALYHAFLHDYEATIPAASGFTPANARDAQAYHRMMIYAYEAHMRDILARMFRVDDSFFQLSVTRTIGMTEMVYVPVVVFMERHQLWGANRDRRNAFSTVNAMNQRIWWEWVWTQTNGPVTAGMANLGSEATYMSTRPSSGVLDGTNVFSYDFGAGPEVIASLRPAAYDSVALNTEGLHFDADYTLPGEWWCYSMLGNNPPTPGIDQCKVIATRIGSAGPQTPPGPFSPFGQFYGDNVANPGNPCGQRAYADTGVNCGFVNLGSAAEEWLWTFAGARVGLYFVEQLAKRGDVDLPATALGKTTHLVAVGNGPVQSPYASVSDRLGYGVAGFHGGIGMNDDLEWLWSKDGQVRAIRTLSAGRHDYEPQNGRYSVGERDTVPSPPAAGVDGDTWGVAGKQEYPGAMENHTPGPSSLYGSAIFNLVLGDQTADHAPPYAGATGLADSLVDAEHRNHVEEFQSWIWLFQASYYRCPNPPSGDPADPACFAFSSTHRKPIFTRPNNVSPTLRFDYLWREDTAALDAAYIADSEGSCTARPGIPWRRVYDRAVSGNPTSVPHKFMLHDEAGYGAYNELLQGTGGLMRLIAERWPLNAADPSFVQQRTDVLKPWFDEAYAISTGILNLYKTPPPLGYGYVPDIENSTCMGILKASVNPDPLDETPAMIAWQQGAGQSVQATTMRRAMFYSIAAVWYFWYDSSWLDAEAL